MFDYLKTASAINSSPEGQLFVFSLEKDSLVAVNNTKRFLEKYKNTQFYYFKNEDYKICRRKFEYPVDHLGPKFYQISLHLLILKIG